MENHSATKSFCLKRNASMLIKIRHNDFGAERFNLKTEINEPSMNVNEHEFPIKSVLTFVFINGFISEY
jgi:hypothetical protein